LYDTLCAAIDELEYNPHGYPTYTPKVPVNTDLHYMLCKKRYRFVFEIIDDTVYVYDIQDCRQDTDKNVV